MSTRARRAAAASGDSGGDGIRSCWRLSSVSGWTTRREGGGGGRRKGFQRNRISHKKSIPFRSFPSPLFHANLPYPPLFFFSLFFSFHFFFFLFLRTAVVQGERGQVKVSMKLSTGRRASGSTWNTSFCMERTFMVATDAP